MTERRTRRVRARVNHRGRMSNRAIVTDEEYAALFADADTAPLFPESAGPALGAILDELAHPTPLAEQDGPPWVHHFPAPAPATTEENNDD